MDLSNIFVLIVLVLALAVLFIAWISTRSRGLKSPPMAQISREVLDELRGEPADPQRPRSTLQSVAGAELSQEEFHATLLSEQIEEMVKKRLKAYDDLARIDVDFGTALDGSLEIWVNGERYGEIDEIPDSRIRKAIIDAVHEFNQ